MRLICIVLVTLLYSQGALSNGLDNTKRAMRILDRIASAAGVGFVKPAIIVGRTSGLASFSAMRKLITIDSGMFRAADRLGNKADDMLATIIGHEFAHYVRGHNYDAVFQHKFGGYASIRDANTTNARLLVGKQDENEADYFGMYYAVLAGFSMRAEDLKAFQAEIRSEYGFTNDSTIYVDNVHQSDDERIRVANTVIDEIKLNVVLHHAANTALMSGEYLQASVLYEYLCRHVNIPSANWNELLARYLYVQQIAGKEVVDPKILRREHIAEFRYRSGEHFVKLDIEQILFRCKGLIEMLRATRLNVSGVNRMDRLVSLYETTNECTECSKNDLCLKHKEEGKQIEEEFRVDASLAGSGIGGTIDATMPTEMMKASAAIDRHGANNKPIPLELSVGRGRILHFEDGGATFVRLEYLAPKSRITKRIDMEVLTCPSCQYGLPAQQDNLMQQSLDGKMIRSATFVN